MTCRGPLPFDEDHRAEVSVLQVQGESPAEGLVAELCQTERRLGFSIVRSMPRYFLDIVDGTRVVDEEGQDLPDLAAAREEAIAGARSLMREEIREGRLLLNERIEIRDDQQRLVATVSFRDAVSIE